MQHQRPFRWRFHHTLLLAILILGFLLRLHGFIWTLPWYFHSDEVRLLENGIAVQENGAQSYVVDIANMSNYPPYRSWEVALTRASLFLIFGEDNVSNSLVVLFGRMFSMAYALLTILFLCHLGRKVSGNVYVGLAAGLFFAVWPQTILFGQRILADGAGLMYFTLCALMSLETAKKGSYRSLSLAFMAGLLSVLGKYNYAPALIFPVLAALTFVSRKQQRFLLRAALPTILFTLPVLYFVTQTVSGQEIYYHYLNEKAQLEGELRDRYMHGYTPESPEVRSLYQRYPLTTTLRLQANYQTLLDFIPAYTLGLAFCGLVVVLVWRDSRMDFRALVILGGVALLTLLTFSFFRVVEGRQLFSAFIPLILLWSIGIGAVGRLSPLAACVILAFLTIPAARQAWEQNDELSKPDSRVATAQWFLDHAQDGTGVALEGIPMEFWERNGYPGGKQFNVANIYRLWEKQPQVWENEGYNYLVADSDNTWRGGYYAGHEKEEFWKPFTEEVVRFEGDDYSGPDRIILRSFRPQTKLEVDFGDVVTLYGYDAGEQTLRGGDSLHVKYFWLAQNPDGSDYIVFNHLVNSETGEPLVQFDRLVGNAGMSPSSTWEEFQWTFDEFDLVLPADAPPGEYTLNVGLYRVADGTRLALNNYADGILPLLEVRVEQ